jgi:hypothetical protein
MTLECEILSAQSRIFRLAERDCGLCLKAISLDSNIPYETLRSYAGHKGAQAMMPVSALCKLVGIIPDELLSHIFEPVGRIIDRPSDESDHDYTVANCIDFVARKQKAHHPESPEGEKIAPCEDSELRVAKARLA